MVLIVVILSIPGLALWHFKIRPHREGMRTDKQMQRAILQLATKCPADVSRERWAHCIGWTWQLHGNYGPYWHWDQDERQGFIEELEQRVNGPVDMATIDWIWNQYVEHADGGENYEGYRPTRPESLAEVDSYGPAACDPLEDWIARYEAARRRR